MTRRRTAPAARARLRWLALSLALLCGGGPLASVVHLLLVRHVTCVEHGELIDADGKAPARRAASEPGLEVADGGAPAHDHDHCVVLAHPPSSDTAPSVEVAAADAPVATSLAAPAHALGHPHPVPLLHLAPKSSPPA